MTNIYYNPFEGIPPSISQQYRERALAIIRVVKESTTDPFTESKLYQSVEQELPVYFEPLYYFGFLYTNLQQFLLSLQTSGLDEGNNCYRFEANHLHQTVITKVMCLHKSFKNNELALVFRIWCIKICEQILIDNDWEIKKIESVDSETNLTGLIYIIQKKEQQYCWSSHQHHLHPNGSGETRLSD